MNKKRYTLYLSRPLARKFDQVAVRRKGAKSALFEEAILANLEPEQGTGVEDGIARRLDEMAKEMGSVQRDIAVCTETLALFVRYFLTITPPLPKSEQEPARLLGRERFQVFVAQVGRRLAEDHRLVSEVLETIATHNPDLFTTAVDDAPPKRGSTPKPPTAANDNNKAEPHQPGVKTGPSPWQEDLHG